MVSRSGLNGCCAAFASLPTPRARLSAPRSHPDPRASTLRLLARVLEKFVAHEGGTYAVFLDFCSLHQKDGNGERTENEGQLFGRALGNLQDLYSHPNAFILKVRAAAAAPRPGPSARAGATAARGSERRPAGPRRPARLSAAPPPPPPSRR